jgi:DNA-binding NtrC family response regulator
MFNEESILISDSDPVFMQSLACHLMDNGIRPTLAADIDTAVTGIANGGFEVAVIEFAEPLTRNGSRSVLASRRGGTELILISRIQSVKLERAARELSPAFYFVKPVDATDIFAVILRILEMKSKRRMAALRRMEQRERVRHE